jgi:uncharacterized iron-regulated membrane protein
MRCAREEKRTANALCALREAHSECVVRVNKLRPRGKTYFRELSFKLHSWLGIGAAAYLLLMSLTGSALIFYPQLYAALSPHPSISSKRPPLAPDELSRVLLKSWPGYEVSWIWPRSDSGAWTVRLINSRQQMRSRVVNAFTGEDLGPAYPPTVGALNLIKDLHENLLLGNAGRTANLVGGLTMLLAAITGAAVWWPGGHSWRRHTIVRRHSRGRRLVWEIHSLVETYLAGPPSSPGSATWIAFPSAKVITRAEATLASLVAP